jgi:hypothetical protein
MFCEIARKLEDQDLERIQSLENDLGLTIVAFSCRSLDDPAREEKLRKMMEELGPQLQAPPAEADDEQLERIREAEEQLGLALVAVNYSES